MRNSNWLFMTLLVVFVSGCGAVQFGGPFDAADTGTEARVPDTWETVVPDAQPEAVSETVIFPDVKVKDEWEVDVLQPPTDVCQADCFDLEPECDEPPFDFGCPCDGNADCKGGYCVEARQGNLCTQSCIDECPEGYGCQILSGTCPDCQYVCIPKWVDLCRPCKSNPECQGSSSAQGDLCVDFGPDGSFCGVQCSGSDDCPEGYVCENVIVQGGDSKQCVPIDGQCECAAKFTNEGAGTSCYVENDFGKCVGERFCTFEGLGPCSALTPAKEACDGKDTDCDGAVDEDMDICSGGKECKCGQGGCACTCPDGLVDCGDGLCLNLQSDVAHCGGCETPCTGDNVETWACQAAVCKIVKCEAGFENFDKLAGTGCECPILPEVCDGLDNDCDAAVDEGDEVCPGTEGCKGTCTDGLCFCPVGCDLCNGMCVAIDSYFSDPNNCGFCGNKCALDHTSVYSCEGGNCCPVACDNGWTDCNKQCQDGCEWEVLQEQCNCGDDDCDGEIDEFPLANCDPPKLCQDCMCQCPTDNPVIQDCGDAGCVDISLSAENCGWCGNNCADNAWANVKKYGCDMMVCTILGCENNYFDVNGQPWDGCECQKTSTAEQCDLLDNDCDGEIDEAPFTDCPAPKVCEWGFCSCPLDQPNLQECEPNQCTDIYTNPKHCGFCDNDCAAMGMPNVSTYGCESGLCTIAACKVPYVDVNTMFFDGCECQKTAATETCDLIDNDCDGQADELPNNCVPPKVCVAGQCICPLDQPNLQECGGGGCTDTNTDVKNCGFCGNVCALDNVGFQKCENGACVVAACKPPFKDCNQLPFDGCEFEVKPEECNAFDDNCNGETDEGAKGVGLQCDSGLPGLCATGVQICEGGSLKCKPNIQPNQIQEVCDGKDNDCDGQIDQNNPGGGGPCTVQGLSGECKFGALECTNAALKCTQTYFPQPEVCDGKDSDCDGIIDGMEEPCSTMCGDGKKKCTGGNWGACSAMEPKMCKNYNGCFDELMCVQQCPSAPMEKCNASDDDCDNSIDETFACIMGDQKSQTCGKCGNQSATCGNTCSWSSWSPCSGEGPCSPGQSKYEGSCGSCGQQKYTCDNSCQWQYSGCFNEGTCSPGSSKTEGSCGKCGKYQYTCSNSCTWVQGACTGEGVCSVGSTKTEGSCGNCGTQQWSCNSSCQWQTSSCTNQGACSPGASKTEGSCGNCGKYQYSCSNSCTWVQGSCTGQGVCTPGTTQWCTACQQKTCSSACQWGSCGNYCGGAKTQGGCYCDAMCVAMGDCCPGKGTGSACAACGNGCNSCELTECGGSGGNCFCDTTCVSAHDCCSNARSTCNIGTCKGCPGDDGKSCDCDWNCGWPTQDPCCSDKSYYGC